MKILVVLLAGMMSIHVQGSVLTFTEDFNLEFDASESFTALDSEQIELTGNIEDSVYFSFPTFDSSLGTLRAVAFMLTADLMVGAFITIIDLTREQAERELVRAR